MLKRKSITSLFLTAAMLLGSASQALAAPQISIPYDAIPLETEEIDAEPGTVSFLTTSAPTEEGQSYLLKLARTGNVDDAASVEITTVDTTATYGDDYRIIVPGQKTKTHKTDGTLLERMVAESKKEDAPADGDEAFEQLMDSAESTDNEAYEELLDIAEQDEANANDEGEEIVEEPSAPQEHPSELARRKAAETGVTPRVIRNDGEATNFESVMNAMFLDEITESMGELLGNSSTTKVEFEPGEAEKDVYITVLDDDISEGNEVFCIYLGTTSEGLELGTANYCALTILDDEPEELSQISFVKDSYTADADKVEVTLKRTNALYLVSSVQLKTVESGTAIAGANFAPLDSKLTFTPFEDEYVFDLPVIPSNKETTFEITLDDFSGATAGDIDTVTVTIPAKGEAKTKKSAKNADNLANDLGASEPDTAALQAPPAIDYALGDITVDGNTFTVDPTKTVPNTSNFPIYKDNKLVGEYIPLTKDLGVSTWTQGTVPNDRKMGSDKHWWLYWNSYPAMGNSGRIGMDAIVDRGFSERFSNTYCYYHVYQYTRNAGGDSLFVDVDMRWVGDDTVSEKHRIKPGKSDGFVLVNMPSAEHTMRFGGVSRFGCAIGGEGNTKYGVDFRGLACFYREVNYSAINPPTIKTRRASDGQRVVDTLPAIATNIGSEGLCRYNDVINVTTTKPDGGEYYGNLKGFKVVFYAGASKYEVMVPPLKDSKGTTTHAFEFNNSVLEAFSYLKWSARLNPTKFTIQPVYDTKPSKIELPSATTAIGNFKDPELAKTASKGGSLNLIYGDRVDLSATCDVPGYDFEGIRIVAKNSPQDTANICDYIEMNPAVLKNFLINKPYYRIYPIYRQQENHINVMLTPDAQKYVRVLDVIPENKLPQGLQNRGGYVINTSVGTSTYVDDKYTPKTGNIYTVKLAPTDQVPSGKAVRVTFTRYGSNDVVNGLSYDFSASSLTEENQIEVDVTLVDASKVEKFAITGVTTTSGRVIRSADVQAHTMPIGDVGITAGGQYVRLKTSNGDYGYNLVRQSTMSNEKDGTFTLAGVSACNGDTITMRLSNGKSEWVQSIKLVVNSSAIADYDYFDYVAGKDVTDKCYNVPAGELPLPMLTADAPYVKDVTYQLDREAAFDNTVWISDKNITMFAEVVPNGRKIKSVLFTKVSLDGTVMEYTAALDQSDRYKVVFDKVEEEFRDGDTMYVSLVDEENIVSTYSYENDKGETVTGKVTSPLTYPMEYTGLTFARLFMPANMHTFTFKSNISSPNIKTLGAIGSDLSAGSGKFEWKPVKEGDFSGYKLSLHFCPSFYARKNGKLINGNFSGQKGYDAYKKARNDMAEALRNDQQDIQDGQFYDQVTDQWYDDEEYTDAQKQQMVRDHAAKDAAQKTFGNLQVKISVMIALDFLFIEKSNDDGSGNGYNLVTGGILVGAAASVSKNFIITVVCGVPIYATVGVDVATQLSLMWTPDPALGIDKDTIEALEDVGTLTFDYVDFLFTITGKVGIGLGLPGVLGARGVIKLNFNIAVGSELVPDPVEPTTTPDPTKPTPKPTPIPTKRVNSGAVKGALSGAFEIDLVLMTFTLNLGTWNFTIKEWGKDKSMPLLAAPASEEVTAGLLSAGTTDMSSFGKNTTVVSGVTDNRLNILLRNAADRTKPSLAQFDNGKSVLFFVGGDVDASGTTHNSVFYSECNELGIWSTPHAINPHSSRDETLPTVCAVGNKAIVSWVETDATKLLDSSNFTSEDARDALNSTNIKYAEFDAETDTLSQPEYVICDGFMDTDVMPLYDKDGLQGVYYVKHDLNTVDDVKDLINQNAAYSTLAFMPIVDSKPVSDLDRLIDLSCEGMEDPLVTDPTATLVNYNGKKYGLLAYSVNESQNEGENPSNDGAEIHLTITDLEQNKDYAPLRLTFNNVSDIEPSFVRFADKLYLCWVSEGYKLCALNISDLLAEAESLGIVDELLSNISSPTWFNLTESAFPSWYDFADPDNYWSHMGTVSAPYDQREIYSGDVSGMDAQSRASKQASLSEYKILNCNDKSIYLLWIDNAQSGREVFGKEYTPVLEEADSDIACSQTQWSDTIQVTSCGQALDEFTALFNANGTLNLCANMYNPVSDSPSNSLIFFNRLSGTVVSLDATKGISFGSYPRADECVQVDYNVSNTGIHRIDALSTELWIDLADGTSKCCATQTLYDIAPNQTMPVHTYWNVDPDLNLIGATARVVCTPVQQDGSLVIVQNNNLTAPVPNGPSFDFSELSTYFDRDKLYVTGTVYNKGNAPTEPVTITITNTGTSDDSTGQIIYNAYDLPSIDVNDGVSINCCVSDFNSSCFDNNGFATLLLTATDGTIKGTADLSVGTSQVYEITSGLQDGENAVLKVGDVESFSANVYPKSASGTKLIYKSSNPAVAYISEDGTITAVSEGEAILTATASDSFAEKNLTVSVTAPKPSPRPSSGGGIKPEATPTPTPVPTPEPTPSQGDTQTSVYSDVNSSDWFYTAVMSLTKDGIVKGTEQDVFEPNSSVTRAMFATMLYRLETNTDEPATYDTPSFKDVSHTDYYYEAVCWALANGIVKGYSDDIFAPNEGITREQAAAMLYRYAFAKGVDVSAFTSTSLDNYIDSAQISDYAIPSMQWVVGKGIAVGDGAGYLTPLSNITRAETAQIIYNYISK